MQIKEEISTLCSFWQYLSNTETEQMLSNTKAVKFQAGTIIHNSQQDCSGLLLVRSGELAAYLTSQEGKQVTIYRLFHGDVCVLSASCIVNQLSMDVQIVAEADTEVFSKSQSTSLLMSCGLWNKSCSTRRITDLPYYCWMK